MKLEPVIGLEIHVQLKTKSKMFCGSRNGAENELPNSTVCEVCTGAPGVLPATNAQAVRWAIKAAKALRCRINPHSKFDRKHYFYPDLPKGYQISQYDLPVGQGGYLEIRSREHPEGGKTEFIKKIRINRVHLEEDAAKLTHADREAVSLVDFNRAGTPLIEIVTEPDFSTPLEAKTFLQELRLIMRYLEVSDADMEKGQLRADANISLKRAAAPALYPKTEIKNLNSFKSVERALEYEIMRQTKLWEEKNPPAVTSTRGFDEAKQITVLQREKEEAMDYRYFPEPDLPPLHLTEIAEQTFVPELPAARRRRFQEELDLSPADARILTDDARWAKFTEEVFSELTEWVATLQAENDEEALEKYREKLGRLAGGWLTSKLTGLMAENKIDIRVCKITPENFAEFIALIFTGKVGSANALTLLQEMLLAGEDPAQIMAEKKLGQVRDPDLLQKAVEAVIKMNPDQVRQYRAGKLPIIQFLVGLVMKETQGQADPQLVKKILEKKLTA